VYLAACNIDASDSWSLLCTILGRRWLMINWFIDWLIKLWFYIPPWNTIGRWRHSSWPVLLMVVDMCVCVRVSRRCVRTRISRATWTPRARTERTRAEREARCDGVRQDDWTHRQGEGTRADEGRWSISPCFVCVRCYIFMSHPPWASSLQLTTHSCHYVTVSQESLPVSRRQPLANLSLSTSVTSSLSVNSSPS